MTNQIEEEVQLTELNVPKYLSKNQQFTVQVTVDSLIDTKGYLKYTMGKFSGKPGGTNPQGSKPLCIF